jgi:hypothetical protein
MSPGLIVLLLVVLAAALVAYQWWRNQQRIAQLREFCLAKGWQFVPLDDEYAIRWTGPPFFQGRSRHARDVINGSVGQGAANRPFVAFDYTYVTDNNGRAGSRQTHRFAVCAVRLPAYLPQLSVTPANALTRLGDTVTGEDIELESEDFNRRFRVRSPDPKFASDVLPPRTMQALLARSSLHFRIEGCDVLCWEPGVTTPVVLLERLSVLSAFVAGIPSFVWHDYGPDLGAGTGVGTG